MNMTPAINASPTPEEEVAEDEEEEVTEETSTEEQGTRYGS